MKRRTFVKTAATAGVAATAAVAASTFPAPAISKGLKQWKLAMSWPLNLADEQPGAGKDLFLLFGVNLLVNENLPANLAGFHVH